MPLTSIQITILRLLAAHRDPESYVAGSTPLNVKTPRLSGDIDIFHDREDRVATAAKRDSEVLLANDFDLRWLRREPALYALVATKAGESTRLEWALDADYRFFPTVPDHLFGYRLHPVDLATNKIMAAAGRREPRDVVDLVTIEKAVLPLGAVVWAAVGKSLGFTPEGLIGEVRRLARYTKAEFDRIASEPPVDPAAVIRGLRRALDDAEAFVAGMPSDKAGLLFLENGKIVQPDPARLDAYTVHSGTRRGHWPSNFDIETSMLDRAVTELGR